jgi:hypothetical protein
LDLSDVTLITILCSNQYFGGLPQAQILQLLTRMPAIRLTTFRRINPCQTYLMTTAILDLDRQGIAVSHRNHPTTQSRYWRSYAHDTETHRKQAKADREYETQSYPPQLEI